MVCFSSLLSAVLLNLQYLQAAHTRTDTHTRANTFWRSFCLSLLSLCLSFSCSLSHTQMQTHVHMYRDAVACGPRLIQALINMHNTIMHNNYGSYGTQHSNQKSAKFIRIHHWKKRELTGITITEYLKETKIFIHHRLTPLTLMHFWTVLTYQDLKNRSWQWSHLSLLPNCVRHFCICTMWKFLDQMVSHLYSINNFGHFFVLLSTQWWHKLRRITLYLQT